MKKNELTIGQYVTTSACVDAQIRTVIKFNYPGVFVTWFEGDHQCGQWVDASLLQRPSKKQLERAEQNAFKTLALPVQ